MRRWLLVRKNRYRIYGWGFLLVFSASWLLLGWSIDSRLWGLLLTGFFTTRHLDEILKMARGE